MYVVLGNIKYKRVIAFIKFFESRKSHEKRELFLRYNYKKKIANFGWLLKHQRGGSISSDEWNSKKYTNKLQTGRQKFRAKVYFLIDGIFSKYHFCFLEIFEHWTLWILSNVFEEIVALLMEPGQRGMHLLQKFSRQSVKLISNPKITYTRRRWASLSI